MMDAMNTTDVRSTCTKKCPGCTIELLNLDNEVCVDYPILLVFGQIKCFCGKYDYSNDHIRLSNSTDSSSTIWPVTDGFFKTFTRLKLGKNFLKIEHRNSPSATKEFNVSYKPSRKTKYVRLIYIVCAGSNGNFDGPNGSDNSQKSALEKISLNASLLQTFMAENLNNHRFGRQTFKLEEDTDGAVKVNVFLSTLEVDNARSMTGDELYQHFNEELSKSDLFDENAKLWVFMSCTKYKPPPRNVFDSNKISDYIQAHTALGGGNMALFGTAGIHTWASRLDEIVQKFKDERCIDRNTLFDDSNRRGTYWGNYATTLGASMHELGHCFDLPHTKSGIMGRGFDDMHLFFLPHKIKEQKIQRCCLSPYTDGGAHWHRSSAVALSLNSWIRNDIVSTLLKPSPIISLKQDVLGPIGASPDDGEMSRSTFDTALWLHNKNLNLAGFIFYYGKYLEAFQALGYRYNEAREPEAVVMSPLFGNTNSRKTLKSCRFILDESDEQINKILIRAGSWIDGIQIFTNYKSSVWCGGNGGNYYCLDFQERKCLGLIFTAGQHVGSIEARVKCNDDFIHGRNQIEHSMTRYRNEMVYGPVGADPLNRAFSQSFISKPWLDSNNLHFGGFILYGDDYLNALQIVGHKLEEGKVTLTQLSPVVGTKKKGYSKVFRFLITEENERIFKIVVRAGGWIDGIQLFSNYKSSIWFGGRGGKKYEFCLDSEQDILSIAATGGTYVGSLQINVTYNGAEQVGEESKSLLKHVCFLDSMSAIKLLEARDQDGDVYFHRECEGQRSLVLHKYEILQGHLSCVLRVLNADGGCSTSILNCS